MSSWFSSLTSTPATEPAAGAAAEERLEPGSWLDPSVKKAALTGRKLEEDWDVTTPAQDAEHRAVNQNVVRTRFPPEPNGYLHIGHAKSMNMNFCLAFEKLGVPPPNRETILRFDDTNPEAEEEEYIESIKADVAWMGWSPVRITYASEYFDQLYALAVQLVKQGDAYVCFQTSTEIEASREIVMARLKARNEGVQEGDEGWPQGNPNSPWRDTSPDENLRLFEDMRKGKYAEGEACLRMKMDMNSTNLNMLDQVAYRVKYSEHPHVGDKWCIYPTYDFTHCVQDALEHVDFSICTLEFEARREPYFWLLHKLNLFKPMVYEMSRLNIEYVVLSKRKLLKLIHTGFFHGWDDPRMPTIKGLRRRGLTASALNKFCSQVGVTRNSNLIQYELLLDVFRNDVDDVATRAMAVLRPIKVTITNFAEIHGGSAVSLTAPDFPQRPAGTSPTHELALTPTLFIDADDFRPVDDPDYRGLAPGKWVGLKYASCIRCDEVRMSADGSAVEELLVTMAQLPPDNKRPKGNLHWVSDADAVPFEARLYDMLFQVPAVTDDNWEEMLNQESEQILTGALVGRSVLGPDGAPPPHESHFQFERTGIFVVDVDTSATGGPDGGLRLVLTRTAPLKTSYASAKDEGKTEDELAKENKRKEDQRKALLDKAAKASLDPKDMFKVGEHAGKYSRFDDEGLPTHTADGEAVTKSALKKLKKEQAKQAKLFAKACK